MDGNQTKVKTSSGEWSVTYNSLNQAILFAQGSKRVECLYDYLNRRVEKAVYEGEILVSKKRFIYRGYQQITELDASSIKRQVEPVLRKTYLWDTAESAVTRILAMTVFNAGGSCVEDIYYMHDVLKNTIALFGIQAGRRALYEFGPYGAIIKMEGNAAEENPFRFSSEYYDDELGLVCYNYRYYNPQQGTWLSREPVGEQGGNNLYGMVNNRISSRVDYLGLIPMEIGEYMVGKSIGFSNLSNQEKQQAREAIGNTPSAQEVADAAQAIMEANQDHLDDFQTALDILGIIEPTPICDLTNSLIHCCRGSWRDVNVSLSGCIPYIGDSLKGIKYINKLKGLGNPFKGKTPKQIDKMFRKKGFESKGENPIIGKGGYVNPKTDRSYHIDPYNRHKEPPYVDVNRDAKTSPPGGTKKKYLGVDYPANPYNNK